MSAMHYRRDTCRLCGSREVELVLPLAAAPVGEPYVLAEDLDKPQETYSLDLYLCRSCGLTQLVDIVDPEVLYCGYVYLTSISLGLVGHYRQYVAEVLDRIQPPKDSFVVDIGSNDGSLLKEFQNKGMRALGIDPGRDVAKLANERGVETLTNFFSSDLAKTLHNERGPAAIITANNVFANVDSLGDMVTGVREWLTTDGVFVIETSYLGDVLEKTLIETVFHEHISYLSVKPLMSFFQRNGMEIIDAQRQPTKGGSIRLMVQKAGGKRAVSPSVAEVLDYEARLKIHDPKTFKAFGSELAKVKADLHAHLLDLKKRGKTIAGYGASVGVVTLLYVFELNNLINFIADDNIRKQNTFTPGHHIPVYAPQALYDRKPDAVVILAWNYAEPIMNKNTQYLKQGGQYIIPLPDVKIVEAAGGKNRQNLGTKPARR
ncbi:MAG: class I SAM-dependent methyltransferase [Verrucomicrobiia bacterium]